MLEDLQAFTAPWKNFRNLRRALEVMETQVGQPCIPFIGTPQVFMHLPRNVHQLFDGY